MTDNAIVLMNGGDFLLPAAPLDTIVATYQAKKNFISQVLAEGVDFGKIPGAGDKPALFKAGAEKMTSFFGLAPVFEDVQTVEDWTGNDHGGEPFFFYRQRCKLYRGTRMIGSADGSCNSWEKKYRYRNSSRLCPSCGKPTIINGKAEYGGGYICFAKKGGCGAKFKAGDKAIEEQAMGEVKNPDIADQVNTILKMAQKRALVAAVLIATNISDYFTQDIEDYTDRQIIDGVVTEVKPAVTVEAPAVKAEPAPVAPEPEPVAQAWNQTALFDLSREYDLAMPRLIMTLKYCALPKTSTFEELHAWMEVYKAHRQEGEAPAVAAESANQAKS